MPRLRKQLRLKIQEVLEENGIYTEAIPPMPSIVDLVADAVLSIPAFAKASAAERHKSAPTMGKNSQDMAVKRLALGERIAAELGIMVDHNKRMWTTVLNKIVEAEADGDSFDKYAAWYKAGNQYNRPKTFQIVKNPALIWGNWKEAQDFETDEPTKAKML